MPLKFLPILSIVYLRIIGPFWIRHHAPLSLCRSAGIMCVCQLPGTTTAATTTTTTTTCRSGDSLHSAIVGAMFGWTSVEMYRDAKSLKHISRLNGIQRSIFECFFYSQQSAIIWATSSASRWRSALLCSSP